MRLLILTNNPAVMTKYAGYDPQPVDGDVRAVFERARDLVHRGRRLLTHPLSSSLKPGRIPYKTIVLTAEPEAGTDLASVNYLAAALDAWQKTRRPNERNWPEQIMADYAAIDLSLLESALESLASETGTRR